MTAASAQFYGAADPLPNQGSMLDYGRSAQWGTADHADAPIGGIPSGTYRTQDGRLVDRYVVPERHAVPDTRVIYSQTTVPEPRVIMEPKTVTVQVPKTVMEPVEYTVQEPRTVMDEKSITVPKIVLEDQ